MLGLLALAAGAAACSSTNGAEADVVVTTSVLGDVVGTIVGDDATVHVVVPPGADPHDFAPSPREAALMREAGVIVVNGHGLEEGLLDSVEAAEADGAVVIAAADGVPDDGDAHFFSDPVLMAAAVEHLADELREHVPALATDAFAARVAAYLEDLDALVAEVDARLAPVPAERRVLVTNHDVLGAFADRFGFEVVGVIVPGGSTLAEPGAADLAALAEAVRELGVPAVFADASAPRRLAEALAAEGTDVEVVELFSESLGEPGSGADTYLGMIRTNAERIAAALAP